MNKKFDLIKDEYGLLKYEVILLMGLNDCWHFTFKEFSLILIAAPKSYGSKYYLEKNIPTQRLLDSKKWLIYIETFRDSNSRAFKNLLWKDFMQSRKIHISRLIDARMKEFQVSDRI